MTVEAPFPSCPVCQGPMTLQCDTDFCDTKYVYCSTVGCPNDGVSAGEVVSELGQPEPGWPRPLADGRPVPWIAPVIGDRVAWAALNATRLRESEQNWLCQVCGFYLGSAPTAWIAISHGEIAAGGGMHTKCRLQAGARCPELRDMSYVFAEVHQPDRDSDWEAVFARLAAYEEQHGQIPRVLPLPAQHHNTACTKPWPGIAN